MHTPAASHKTVNSQSLELLDTTDFVGTVSKVEDTTGLPGGAFMFVVTVKTLTAPYPSNLVVG